MVSREKLQRCNTHAHQVSMCQSIVRYHSLILDVQHVHAPARSQLYQRACNTIRRATISNTDVASDFDACAHTLTHVSIHELHVRAKRKQVRQTSPYNKCGKMSENKSDTCKRSTRKTSVKKRQTQSEHTKREHKSEKHLTTKSSKHFQKTSNTLIDTNANTNNNTILCKFMCMCMRARTSNDACACTCTNMIWRGACL
jgi:hypothetical protein